MSFQRTSRTRRLVSWIGPSVAVGLVLGAAAGAFAAGAPDPVRPVVVTDRTTATNLQVLNPQVTAGRSLYVIGAVRGDGFRPTGRVELLVDGREVDSERLVVATATLKVTIDRSQRGSHTVVVRYEGGSGALGSSSRSVTVHVR